MSSLLRKWSLFLWFIDIISTQSRNVKRKGSDRLKYDSWFWSISAKRIQLEEITKCLYKTFSISLCLWLEINFWQMTLHIVITTLTLQFIVFGGFGCKPQSRNRTYSYNIHLQYFGVIRTLRPFLCLHRSKLITGFCSAVQTGKYNT